jgi:hypothetical protein
MYQVLLASLRGMGQACIHFKGSLLYCRYLILEWVKRLGPEASQIELLV